MEMVEKRDAGKKKLRVRTGWGMSACTFIRRDMTTGCFWGSIHTYCTWRAFVVFCFTGTIKGYWWEWNRLTDLIGSDYLLQSLSWVVVLMGLKLVGQQKRHCYGSVEMVPELASIIFHSLVRPQSADAPAPLPECKSTIDVSAIAYLIEALIVIGI